MSKNKSFSSEISERYALALYGLCKEENKIEEFESKMVSLISLYESSDDLKNFVKNPTYSMSNQINVFNQIATRLNFSKTLKNFISLLIAKKRIFFLDKIVKEFLKTISTKRGELKANLISSKKIENKTILEIEKEISDTIKRSIKLNYKIDESLIGGIILQLGSLMIDTSIKNKLKKYEQSMIEV